MNTPMHYLAAIALTLVSAGSFAHDYTAGPLKIGHPWSRATPGGAKVGGGYFTIENTGSMPDRLIAASVPFAARAEMHEMATANGVMTMRELDKGIAIPAGGKVEFKPGGLHVMFVDLKQPLKQDERLKGTLTFEKAGTVEIEFKVEGMGVKDPGATAGPAEAHKH